MTRTAEPKRRRTKLAKSELWLALAATAQRWSDEVGDKPGTGTLPFAQWGTAPGDMDPFHELCQRYDLSAADLSRILEHIAEQLENRALRNGYDEAWV